MRRRSATAGTAALALAGAALVWLVAARLFPYHSLNHDEGVYLQQAAMLLDGRLFLRPPVEGVFRPWFFVDSARGLYPKYAPVPAAMFAAGKLLGGYRLALAGIAAGNVALTAGVVREAFDRRTALVAAAFVLASPLFVLDSSVFLPYAPTYLLNLAFAYCYLRADRSGDARWAAAAGAAVGLAFFARPYTAVLFATPFVAHALWTLRGVPGELRAGGSFAALSADARARLRRQSATAAVGFAGVAVALGYNALVTGSPLVFPYEAFAPLDGLGFGRRRILNHEVVYTPELALRANARVLRLFFAEWIAGGGVGAALAAGGLAVAVRRGLDARRIAVAGVFLTVSAGNVYFWGNVNVLGDLDRAGDGLVAVLGPYYHFDLLLPTATFAAVAVVALASAVRQTVADRPRFDPRAARVAGLAVLLVTAGVVGAVTATVAADPVERNAQVTRTYEAAYEPFGGGAPADSLVLLPDPYGDWLDHPFQALRNDPGFDGRAVYAVDERPFETVDAFPNRTVYRYAYRGGWAPSDGSPEAARLQRVRDVRGSAVAFDGRVGVPSRANGVTVRVGTDGGSAYYAANGSVDAVAFRLRVTEERVSLRVPRARANETLALSGSETVRVSAFVDYGPGGSFAYRLDLPVESAGDGVRALSPKIELCRGARACGGGAAYVPETAPEGVFVETNLTAETGLQTPR
ncbi:MAG: glycosyltransferase family 39 protein [Halosimplex sp.]